MKCHSMLLIALLWLSHALATHSFSSLVTPKANGETYYLLQTGFDGENPDATCKDAEKSSCTAITSVPLADGDIVNIVYSETSFNAHTLFTATGTKLPTSVTIQGVEKTESPGTYPKIAVTSESTGDVVTVQLANGAAADITVTVKNLEFVIGSASAVAHSVFVIETKATEVSARHTSNAGDTATLVLENVQFSKPDGTVEAITVPVIDVKSGVLTLKGVTATGIKLTDKSFAEFTGSSSLTMEGTNTFESIETTGNGAVFSFAYTSDPTQALGPATFTGCKAAKGGAIYISITADVAALTGITCVSGTTFTSCIATSKRGHNVYIDASAKTELTAALEITPANLAATTGRDCVEEWKNEETTTYTSLVTITKDETTVYADATYGIDEDGCGFNDVGPCATFAKAFAAIASPTTTTLSLASGDYVNEAKQLKTDSSLTIAGPSSGTSATLTVSVVNDVEVTPAQAGDPTTATADGAFVVSGDNTVTLTVQSLTLSVVSTADSGLLKHPVITSLSAAGITLNTVTVSWDTTSTTPMTASLISLTNGKLTLTACSFTSIQLNDAPLLKISTANGNLEMNAGTKTVDVEGTPQEQPVYNTFTSITRAAGSGAVFEVTLADENAHLPLSNVQFTNCISSAGVAGAVYVIVSSATTGLTFGTDDAKPTFEQTGTDKFKDQTTSAITLGVTSGSYFGEADTATSNAGKIASFSEKWNAEAEDAESTEQQFYCVSVDAEGTTYFPATLKSYLTAVTLAEDKIVYVAPYGPDVAGCGVTAFPCGTITTALTKIDATVKTIQFNAAITYTKDNVQGAIGSEVTIQGTTSNTDTVVAIAGAVASSDTGLIQIGAAVTFKTIGFTMKSITGAAIQAPLFSLSSGDFSLTLETVKVSWTAAATTADPAEAEASLTKSVIVSTNGKLSLTASVFTGILLSDCPLLTVATSAADSLTMIGANQFTTITRSTGNGAVFSVTVTTGDVYLPISHATFTDCKCTEETGDPAAVSALGGSIYVSTSVALKSFLGDSLTFSGSDCAKTGLYIYYESTAEDNTANLFSNGLPTLDPTVDAATAGSYVAKNYVDSALTEVQFSALTAKPVDLTMSGDGKDNLTPSYLTIEAALGEALPEGYTTRSITIQPSVSFSYTSSSAGTEITSSVTISGAASETAATLSVAGLNGDLFKITGGASVATEVEVKWVNVAITASATPLSKAIFSAGTVNTGIKLTLDSLSIASGIENTDDATKATKPYLECKSGVSVISFATGQLELNSVSFTLITLTTATPLIAFNPAKDGLSMSGDNAFTSIIGGGVATINADTKAGGAVFRIESTSASDEIHIEHATFTDCGMAGTVPDYNGGIIYINLKEAATVAASSLAYSTTSSSSSRSNAATGANVYIVVPATYAAIVSLRGFLPSPEPSTDDDKAKYMYIGNGKAAATPITDIPKPIYLKHGGDDTNNNCLTSSTPCATLKEAYTKAGTTYNVIVISSTAGDDNTVALAAASGAAFTRDISVQGEIKATSVFAVSEEPTADVITVGINTESATTPVTVIFTTLTIKIGITAVAASGPKSLFQVTSTEQAAATLALSDVSIETSVAADASFKLSTYLIEASAGVLSLCGVSISSVELTKTALLHINTAADGFSMSKNGETVNTFTSIERTEGSGAFLEETLSPAVTESSSRSNDPSPATKISIANAEFTDCSSTEGVGIMYFTVLTDAPADALAIATVTYKATPAATEEQPNPTAAAVDWTKMDEHSCAVGFYAATVALFAQSGKYDLTTLATSDSKQYYAKVGEEGLVTVLHHYLHSASGTINVNSVSGSGYAGDTCGWEDLPCSTFATASSKASVTTIKVASFDSPATGHAAETLFTETGATVSKGLTVDGETTTTTAGGETSSTYAKISVSSSSTTNPVITITGSSANADDITVEFKNLDFVLDRTAAIAVPVFKVSNYKAPVTPGVRENAGTGKVAVTLTHITFTSTGSTSMTSAVIVQESGSLTIQGGCTFKDIAGKGVITSTLGSGDALTIKISADEKTFESCTTTTDGGALSVTFSAASTGTFTLGEDGKAVTFKDCTATGKGGAIYITSPVSITSLFTFKAAFEGTCTGTGKYVYYEATEDAAKMTADLVSLFLADPSDTAADNFIYKDKDPATAADMTTFLDSQKVQVTVQSDATADTCKADAATKQCLTIATALALTETSTVSTGNTITIIGSGLTLSNDGGSITKGVTITGDANTKVTVTSALTAAPLFTIGTGVTSALNVEVSTMTVSLTASDDKGATGAITKSAFEIGTVGTGGSVSLTLTSVTFTTSDAEYKKLAYVSTTLIDASKGTLTLAGCIFQYITVAADASLITAGSLASQLVLNKKDADADNTFTSITRTSGTGGAVFTVTVSGKSNNMETGIALKNAKFVQCTSAEDANAGAVLITITAAGGTLTLDSSSLTFESSTVSADKDNWDETEAHQSGITFIAATSELLTSDDPTKGYDVDTQLATLADDKKFYAKVSQGPLATLYHYLTLHSTDPVYIDSAIKEEFSNCGWEDLPCKSLSKLSLTVSTTIAAGEYQGTASAHVFTATLTVTGAGSDSTKEECTTITVKTGDSYTASTDDTITFTRLRFLGTGTSAKVESNLISMTGSAKLDLTDVVFSTITLTTSTLINVASGSLEVTGSAFESIVGGATTAGTASGGVFSITLVADKIASITSTTFTSCSSTTSGGAISVTAAAAGTLALGAVTFTSCTATGKGGAIYITASVKPTYYFAAVTFATDNTAAANGGKNLFYEATVADANLDATLVNSFLKGQTVTSADGNYMYVDKEKTTATDMYTFLSERVIRATVQKAAGTCSGKTPVCTTLQAALDVINPADVSVGNTLTIDSTAELGDSSVASISNGVTITTTSYTFPLTRELSGDLFTVTADANHVAATVENIIFSLTTADLTADKVLTHSLFVLKSQNSGLPQLTLSSITVKSSVDKTAAGINVAVIDADEGMVVIEGSTFQYITLTDTATGYPLIAGSQLIIQKKDTTSTTFSHITRVKGNGAVLEGPMDSVMITGTTFEYCETEQSGGAIAVTVSSEDAELTIGDDKGSEGDVTFKGCSGGKYGGAIYISSSVAPSNIKLQNVKFDELEHLRTTGRCIFYESTDSDGDLTKALREKMLASSLLPSNTATGYYYYKKSSSDCVKDMMSLGALAPIVSPATLHDNTEGESQVADEDLYKDGTYTLSTSTDETTQVTTITISIENLQWHQNAQDTYGYWVGPFITPPNDDYITHYYFSDAEFPDLTKDASWTTAAAGGVNKWYEPFYVNAYGIGTVKEKKYVALKTKDAEDTEKTYKFIIDTSAVEVASLVTMSYKTKAAVETKTLYVDPSDAFNTANALNDGETDIAITISLSEAAVMGSESAGYSIAKGLTVSGGSGADDNSVVFISSTFTSSLFTIGKDVKSAIAVGVSSFIIALEASEDNGATGAVTKSVFKIGDVDTGGSVSLTLTSVIFTTSDVETNKPAYVSTTLIDASKGTLTLAGCGFQFITLTTSPLITTSTTGGLTMTKNGDTPNTFNTITRKSGSGSVFELSIASGDVQINNAAFIKCGCEDGNGGALYSLVSGGTFTLGTAKSSSSSSSNDESSLVFSECYAKASTKPASMKDNADADGSGGAVYVEVPKDANSVTVRIADVVIADSTASKDGKGNAMYVDIRSDDTKVEVSSVAIKEAASSDDTSKSTVYIASTNTSTLTAELLKEIKVIDSESKETSETVIVATQDADGKVDESSEKTAKDIIAEADDGKDDIDWGWWKTFLIVIAGLIIIAAVVVAFIYLLIIRPKKVSPEGADGDKSVKNPPSTDEV